MTVLIVPDKFKGTLSAREAAQAIAEGWARRRPDDTLQLLPMSDGGDGFGEVIAGLLHAEIRTVETVNAAHEPWTGRWWWVEHSKTAIIETAQTIGLALLPHGQFHPYDLDTLGLGKLFHAAAGAQCRSCLVGIGGSATNDGGFGLAKALGWRFLDQNNHALARWTDLDRLARIYPPAPPLALGDLIIAVDVQNPLLGTTGATRIYGPQKGLRPNDFPQAERCLTQLAAQVHEFSGTDIAAEPGTGAAGGLGFGLRAFLGGRFEPGIDVFARLSHLEDRLAAVDLVITGEGAIDQQTLMGKGVGAVALLGHKVGIPVIGLAGSVSPDCVKPSDANAFTAIHGISPALVPLPEAKARPAHWLARLAEDAASDYR